MTRLTLEQELRLNTWTLRIAEELYDHSEPWVDRGDERHFPGHGGLYINQRLGCWYVHGGGPRDAGWTALGLIQFLKSCSYVEAVDFAIAWLNSHEGTGGVTGSDDEEDARSSLTRSKASIARAAEIEEKIRPAAGTLAETYLRDRKCWLAAAELYFLKHARIGEDALGVPFKANDRRVGYHLIYLTPRGCKSSAEPKKQTFMREAAPHAVVEIQAARNGNAKTIICEGVEDALSVAQLGRPERIIALCGIARLRRLSFKKGAKVLVIADGDAPNSPARRSLVAGTDHLLLDCGAEVEIAYPSAGKDANDYLTEHTSFTPLIKLIASAGKATLSLEGECERLAGMEPLKAAMECSKVADRFRKDESGEDSGIGVGEIRKEVDRRRKRRAAESRAAEAECKQEEAVAAAAALIPRDRPWGGTVPPLVKILDDIVVQLRRYLFVAEHWFWVLAVWCAHTHLVHHRTIRLPISPRLALRSETGDSGKSTTLDIVETLAASGISASSITPAVIFRLVNAYRVCLCVDEADDLFRDPNSGMRAILNAGHRRSKALAWRVIPPPDGKGDGIPTPFDVWGAMCFAHLRDLPGTLPTRVISIPMYPAPAGAGLERYPADPPPGLIELRRQLAAWAAALTELPDVELPVELRNRGRDNWEPLFRIAALADEAWQNRIVTAVKAATGIPIEPPEFVRLVLGIHQFFANMKSSKEGTKRGTADDLLQFLLADKAAGWDEANRGRAINAYWLSKRLFGRVQNPARNLDWWEGPASKRVHKRGYREGQFTHLFETYLDDRVFHYYTGPRNPPIDGADGAHGSTPGPRAPSAPSKSLPQDPPNIQTTEGAPSSASGNGETAPFDGATELPDGAEFKALCAKYGLAPQAVRAIQGYRREHPDWSVSQVRNRVHMPKSVVEQVFREFTPPEWVQNGATPSFLAENTPSARESVSEPGDRLEPSLATANAGSAQFAIADDELAEPPKVENDEPAEPNDKSDLSGGMENGSSTILSGENNEESGSSPSSPQIDPDLRRQILRLHAENPGWQVDTLRRRLGVSRTIIRHVLQDAERQP
jgi:putative DNA primase/helicase